MLKEDSRTSLRDAKIAATQEKTRAGPKKNSTSQHARNAVKKPKSRSCRAPTDRSIAASVSHRKNKADFCLSAVMLMRVHIKMLMKFEQVLDT